MVKIAKYYNCSPGSIDGILKRNGIQKRSNKDNSRRFNVNHDYFEKIDSEEKAYWLGFIAADGYVNKANCVGVTLASKDHAHLLKLAKATESTYEIKQYNLYSSYSSGKCSRFLVKSEK